MGTSKKILEDKIYELWTMLSYIKRNYPQVYDEAEAHQINEEVE